MEGALVLDEVLVIAQVGEGNVDAFAEIIGQYQAPIQRWLYRLTGDCELAETQYFTSYECSSYYPSQCVGYYGQ